MVKINEVLKLFCSRYLFIFLMYYACVTSGPSPTLQDRVKEGMNMNLVSTKLESSLYYIIFFSTKDVL